MPASGGLPGSPHWRRIRTYGRLMADALREVASASGATVTRVEYLRSRAPTIPRRRSSGCCRSESLRTAQTPTGAGAPPFDALLLPEGGPQLKQIGRQLKEAAADAKPLQLLGSGLWDVPDIGSEPALVGGWFAASPPEPRRDFEQRYQATYGRAPPRLASLGYDAAALAAVLARAEEASPSRRRRSSTPTGLPGSTGCSASLPEAWCSAALPCSKSSREGEVVVSPAPQNFQDFAY